jgi:hypothetical protein
MRLHRFAVIVLSFLTAPFAAGDHFPIAQGKTWLFSYLDQRGGWGDVLIDSGTVSWQMVQVTTDGAAPGTVTTTVRMLRTFNQYRKTYKPGGMMAGTANDSIFSPPRSKMDTVFFTSSTMETGIASRGDTCWSFVHDPKASFPAGKVSIRDTVVQYKGQATAASIIDQKSCRSRFSDRISYITVQDVGPVEYHNRSPEDLMDAFWETEWKLVDVATSVGHGEKPSTSTRTPLIRIHDKGIFFEGQVSCPGTLVVSFYNVNGVLLRTVETGISSAGFRRIEIPVSFRRGAPHASVPCIVRLVAPDGTHVTGMTALY